MIGNRNIAVIGTAEDACIELSSALMKLGVSCSNIGAIFVQASEALELTTKCNKISMPWIDPNEPVFNERKHIETCTKNRIKRRNKKRK